MNGLAANSHFALTEEMLRAAVECAPLAMIMVDQGGRIIVVNQETERMFGYRRRELLGRLIETLIPTRFRGGHPAQRTEFFMNPSARRMGAGRELFGLRKDGSEFPVEIGLNPIRLQEELFVLSAVVDITERRRSEDLLRRTNEELIEKSREMEQFAYIASHDLREPLRMVASYVQLLEKRYADKLDSDAHDFIEYAVAGTVRMRRLIDDLLAYSRVSNQVRKFEPTDCDLVFRQAVSNLEACIQECNAEVVSGPLPTVLGDATQLTQLFQNLISNAVKYRGEQRPIVRIQAARQDRAWLFSVADNGIGIEPQYADRIFVMFQRLHAKDKYSGTGIGLAICKKVVQRHGGRIWVESQLGNGATFYFTLAHGGEEP